MNVALIERPSTQQTQARAWPTRGHALAVAISTAIAISVLARVWQLGSLPGVNGDEAWSGVQAVRLVTGQSAEWTTPAGNPLNPFFMGPLVLLHAVFPPSFGLLRSVALASGLVALVVNFRLCRRLYGTRTATIATLILAVLPINIAYSRFAWDASQTLLFAVLTVYPALLSVAEPQRRTTWMLRAALGLGAAVLVHPTNIFLAPILVVAALEGNWTRLADWFGASQPWSRRATRIAATILLVGGVAWLLRSWLAGAVLRLGLPSEACELVFNLARLLSGATVYRFITGSIPYDPASPPAWWSDIGPWDVAALSALAVALVGAARLLRQRRAPVDRCLAIGSLLVLAGFYLIAGAKAASPHYERYAMLLVLPVMLVVARGVSWWLAQPQARTKTQFAVGATVVLLLGGLYVNYFQFLHATGGAAHRAFRTAAVEPKQQCWELIERSRSPDKAVHIVTSEWWSAWPLRYLAAGSPEVEVVSWNQLAGAGDIQVSLSERPTWLVEFTDGAYIAPIRNRLQALNLAAQETLIRDYAQRPVLVVLKVVPPTADRRLRSQTAAATSTAPSTRPATASIK